MNYELVIGLEVFLELATESKLFCGCPAKPGAGPNENVCPACAGMPGMLPIANRRAIDLGIAAGLATGCKISPVISFDKKNYFCPELPNGYQITQRFAPLCADGAVEIETGGGAKKIRIKRIYITEDTGRLGRDGQNGACLLDLNRAGAPLCGIVSQPDFCSAQETATYLAKLSSLLNFAGASGCKMDNGPMRCEANLSVHKPGGETPGARTKIKNIGSAQALVRAVEYEYSRHVQALETGRGTLAPETRVWDDEKNRSLPAHGKEGAADYRYYPNPDIMPITISEEWVAVVRAGLDGPAEQAGGD